MSEDARSLADRLYVEVLERTGARDLRDSCREYLLTLRGRSRSTFATASAYFTDHVVPAIAAEGRDPIAEWVDYGRYLAALLTEGETVQIDASGRSHPYAPPVPLDHVVLHLPRSSREPAIAVALPGEMSMAQKATYDLLVLRKTS